MGLGGIWELPEQTLLISTSMVAITTALDFHEHLISTLIWVERGAGEG